MTVLTALDLQKKNTERHWKP